MILDEHDLLVPAKVAVATKRVWAERNGVQPPAVLPPLPESWPIRYEHLAADHDLNTRSFPNAVARVGRLWVEMFPAEEA